MTRRRVTSPQAGEPRAADAWTSAWTSAWVCAALVPWLAPAVALGQEQPDAGAGAGVEVEGPEAAAPQPPVDGDPPQDPAEEPWWDRGEPRAPAGAPAPTEPPPGPGPETPEGSEAEEPGAGDGGDEEGARDGAGRFVFGSYGRVVAATDLDGRTGRDADIVSRGPRLDEGTYAELELRREDDLEGFSSRVVATLAVRGPLFHFDGEPEDRLAVRNLFLEIDDAFVEGLSLWAGSRMVRGDDVYLFDFWPMDNLNALGGGVRYAHAELFEAAVTVGLARPNDPFQTQVVDVLPVFGFEPSEVLLLDRPRTVLALKGTYFALGRGERGLKLSLYGEHHAISSGVREDDAGVRLRLPSDTGFVFGAQLGGWLTAHRAFVNLFVRWARGLGAYDPLGVPFRTGTPIDTERAEELLVGISANFERGPFGVQLGGWVRRFRDADPSLLERAALAEGAIAVRPHVWFGELVGLALEASYQGLETTALDERTGAPVAGSAVKLGVVPFVSPMGRGTYTRPHLRLIYSVTLRDEGARALYPPGDPRSAESHAAEHFLGIGAEWWFDSSSYQ